MKVPVLGPVSSPGMTDPIGVLITSAVGFLGLFGVFTMLGWTSDMVGMFCGFAGAAATAIRTLVKAKGAAAALPPGE